MRRKKINLKKTILRVEPARGREESANCGAIEQGEPKDAEQLVPIGF
jgi:hypothetical protein